MCLILLAYKKNPAYQLVLAANRDEFYARPTASLDFVGDERSILAGRDLHGGGTWLAIDKQMRLGAITNYRDPTLQKQDAPTRGNLILDYLHSNYSAKTFADLVQQQGDKYNGFNLILADKEGCYYCSNQLESPVMLPSGFYGLSNHLLDSPWPKVMRAKQLLYADMVEAVKIDPETILNRLGDTWQPPKASLPNTGVPEQWEVLLGTIFINGDTYGTRSSTVLTVSEGGRVDFIERTHQRTIDGKMQTSQSHCFF